MMKFSLKIGGVFTFFLFISSHALDEGLFFEIITPAKLAFIYQINPSYKICSRFPSYAIKDISLVYADPSEGCSELKNADLFFGEVILMERGGCPFVKKALNAEKAGARIAIITDSSSGNDDFIEMVSDETGRKANISCAWLPGVSGRRLREYLLYEKPIIPIRIPLNFTSKSLRDTYAQKPPWELW